METAAQVMRIELLQEITSEQPKGKRFVGNAFVVFLYLISLKKFSLLLTASRGPSKREFERWSDSHAFLEKGENILSQTEQQQIFTLV